MVHFVGLYCIIKQLTLPVTTKKRVILTIPLLESNTEIMLSCSVNGNYYRNNPVEYSQWKILQERAC